MNIDLPDWLYESLPYIYVGTGALTLYKLNGVIASFSGWMLLAAGIFIWKLRRDYRLQQKLNKGRQAGASRFGDSHMVASRFADSNYNSWFGDSQMGDHRLPRTGSTGSENKKVRKPN